MDKPSQEGPALEPFARDATEPEPESTDETPDTEDTETPLAKAEPPGDDPVEEVPDDPAAELDISFEDVDEIDDDLLTQAVQLGMSVSEAKAIGNASALQAVLKVLQRSDASSNAATNQFDVV